MAYIDPEYPSFKIGPTSASYYDPDKERERINAEFDADLIRIIAACMSPQQKKKKQKRSGAWTPKKDRNK